MGVATGNAGVATRNVGVARVNVGFARGNVVSRGKRLARGNEEVDLAGKIVCSRRRSDNTEDNSSFQSSTKKTRVLVTNPTTILNQVRKNVYTLY